LYGAVWPQHDLKSEYGGALCETWDAIILNNESPGKSIIVNIEFSTRAEIEVIPKRIDRVVGSRNGWNTSIPERG
jgi:hypothetical protein